MSVPQTYDCVVIGAGASGLAAACTLNDAGKDFVVLEARDEIGGRARTTRTADGTPYERGALVLHGAVVATWDHVIRHGLTTHGTTFRDWHDAVIRVDGAWQRDDPEAFEQQLLQLGEILRAQRGTGASVLEALEQSDVGADVKHALTRMAVAATPDPAALDAAATGEHFRGEAPDTPLFVLPEGYSELWRRLSEPFASRIQRQEPVLRVEWRDGGAVVHTGVRAYATRTVILTLPLGVLKAGVVDFDPPLPDAKSEAIDGLVMAQMVKVGLVFRRPFWRDDVGSATAFSWETESGFDHCYELYATWPGPPTLVATTALTGGLSGDATALGEAFLDELTKIFPAIDVRAEVVETLIDDWPADPWSRGSFFLTPVNAHKLPEQLALPTPPLFWAGEACTALGYVEGALTSGRAAAVEALHMLRPFRIGEPVGAFDWSRFAVI
jgi:monoamine oxidase